MSDSVTSFGVEMESGEQALLAGRPGDAFMAFARAHDVGHAVKKNHLAAHRGMVRAAMRAGRVDRALKNLALMSAAFVFDRERPAVA